jgi:AcrR family transcriptional regulator
MTIKIKRHPDSALAEARRAQVLNAAADCFRRRGYHAAGMAEIAPSPK